MAGNIPLEELARLPSFYVPKLSWNRNKLAFYWDKSGRIELYVLDLTTREVTQVSDGSVPRTPRAPFIWTRDDTHIVFGKDMDGNEQNDHFLLNVATGDVTQLTRDPESQEYAIEVSPDNEWLLLVTNRFGQLNLARVRLDDAQAYEQLTNYPTPVWGAAWSPDGQWVAFTSNEERNMVNQDIYIMRNDGSEQRRLLQVTVGSKEEVADWHPNGRFLAITSDASGDNRPGLLDVETGAVRWLGVEGQAESAVRFSENGRYLSCLRNHNATIRPVLYNTETGNAKELDLPDGLAIGADFVNGDTQLVAGFATPTRRQELVLYDLASDSYETLLKAGYGSIDPTVFVDSKHIWYPSFDGRDIPALLHMPRDIGDGEKRPAIIIVHGGPTAQFFQQFDPYAQYLADQGYVILKPNVRGSTGYGVEFRDMNRYDLGGGDLEDVAYGAEYLKSLPQVDGERIGIFGGSYGGYMTFMAMTKKPELWRAGTAAVGITHWRTLYDESMEHFKWYLRMLLGDPDENADLLEDRSALNFAHQLQGKLQIIHGLNDPRCPISQARIFRDRLLAHGYAEGDDFEYVELGEQGHGSVDQAQKVVWYTLLADFMAKHL